MAIKKRSNGRYTVSIFRGYETNADGSRGKRLEHCCSFRLLKDAQRWEREQHERVERGSWIEPTKLTVRQWVATWKEAGLKTGRRERTRQSYRQLLDVYALPIVGDHRLDRLTRPVVQRMAAQLLDQPLIGAKPKEEGGAVPTLSPSTVRRTLAALSVALESAVEARLIAENPARRISLPPASRKVPRWLARDEVRVLLDGTRDDPLGGLWALLAFTGLRPSEALGLEWEHLDLDTGTVRVAQTIVPQKASEGRRWRTELPKTTRSERTVPIEPDAVRLLLAQRDRQQAERLVMGARYRECGNTGTGFVFNSPTGEPLREDVTLKRLKATLKRLGLPDSTLYALRHGHASLMLEAGVSLVTVSRRLGHASVTLTADVYSHVTDALQRQASETFGAYMAPKVVES